MAIASASASSRNASKGVAGAALGCLLGGLGRAVSAGGVTAPIFGALADAHGPAIVFTVLCVVPVVTYLFGSRLAEPVRLC